MKLSIIIVNYNGGDLLKNCLSSIYRETNDISFELILVDNASTDDSADVVAREFPNVYLIRNSRNTGFAAANNQGIRQAMGEYVLLLNPDTEVLDGALLKSIQFMEGVPSAGIVGCKLLFPDRSLQPSVSAFPTVLSAFMDATFLYLLVPKNRIIGRTGIAVFDYNTPEEVDCVMGAFFLIRRSLLEDIGLLEDQFFMYSEETDFCFRARFAGYQVWYTPDAEVIHYWSGVSSPTMRGIGWLHISQRFFLQKHYHGFEKHAINILRLLGAAARVPVYFAIGCLSLNKKLTAKSYYFAHAIYKMLTENVRYKKDTSVQETQNI